jgi:hypothetical protein
MRKTKGLGRLMLCAASGMWLAVLVGRAWAGCPENRAHSRCR